MVPVQVYAKTVFMQTDPDSADMYTVIFALVLMCGSMVTAAIADKAGRRVRTHCSNPGNVGQLKILPPKGIHSLATTRHLKISSETSK